MCRAEENSGRKVRVHENRKILFGGTTVPISLLLYTILQQDYICSSTQQAIVPLVHFPGCALCSWWLCFRTTVRWTLGTKQSSTGSWYTLFQNSNFDLEIFSLTDKPRGRPHCILLVLIDFCSVQSEFLTWSFAY